jgi:hypothetical protein
MELLKYHETSINSLMPYVARRKPADAVPHEKNCLKIT